MNYVMIQIEFIILYFCVLKLIRFIKCTTESYNFTKNTTQGDYFYHKPANFYKDDFKLI